MSRGWAYLTMVIAVPVFAVMICQVAMLATTVYLHRYLAHGAIELRPEVRAVARVVIWTTTALKPRQWAGVHRYHHAAEDTPDDPHSPANFGGERRGAWHVFWHNAPLYTHATRDPRLVGKYRDLTADRWDHWFFDHGEMGLLIGVGVACITMAGVGRWLVGGWIGIAIGIAVGLGASGLHAASYVLAGGAINGFGHAGIVRRPNSGYATNMPVLAWLTVGEGWHRNHHLAENSPRLGYGRQLDLGWVAICGLHHLRLATVTTRGAAGLRRFQSLSHHSI
ncbi:MAG TPA: fatty acid desaturase [Acidimicrobiia bacterium]|nr:fatty acid desaturase [Acidimicrobiia bacterium]